MNPPATWIRTRPERSSTCCRRSTRTRNTDRLRHARCRGCAKRCEPHTGGVRRPGARRCGVANMMRPAVIVLLVLQAAASACQRREADGVSARPNRRARHHGHGRGGRRSTAFGHGRRQQVQGVGHDPVDARGNGDVVGEGSLLVQVDGMDAEEPARARRVAGRSRGSRAWLLRKHRRNAPKACTSRAHQPGRYENAALSSRMPVPNWSGSQISIEYARFALDDTEVVAPVTGTVIEKLVERGQVISSPVMRRRRGTVLMRMADLSRVQVQALRQRAGHRQKYGRRKSRSARPPIPTSTSRAGCSRSSHRPIASRP